MNRALLPGLFAAAMLAGCDSKVTTTTDPVQQARYETLTDCFPGLYAKAELLLDIADTWRLQSGSSIADPAGLSFAEQGDGSVTLTYTVAGTTVAMTIVFYSPTGVAQNLNLGSPSSLNDLIDVAADELRTSFPSGDSFLVGEWTATGGGISGTGALTGILTRSGSQDRLFELRTTTATPAGGPPPAATGVLTDNGPPVCTLTFDIPGLQLDAAAQQAYPVGDLDLTLAGPQATITASVTFDGTSTASIVVTGINGTFRFNIATRALTFVP